MSLSTPYREKQLRLLVQKLGLSSQAAIRWDLLDQALTDPTASTDANYERLEFVGDAVVRLAAAELLFELYPDATDGELSALRSPLVSDRILAEIGDRYGLDRYLLMGGSAIGDVLGRETRLAASLEALLAALYLSTHSLSLVRPWLDSHFKEFARIIRDDPAMQNYKGALQVITQGTYQTLPEYRIVESGQATGDPERFAAEVWVNGECLGRGKGPSKKAAEQAAAQEAFLVLRRFSEI